MPITLADAKNLSQDKLTNFVIDDFRTSPLLDLVPFDNTVKPQGGESLTYTYNRLTTQPTADGRAINSEYTPQESKTTPVSVDLKPFGGSFEVDRVIQNHERQVVNHVNFQLQQKTKATKALWHDWFINGDIGANPLSFDGLDKIITGSSTELSPTATIDLSSSTAIDTNWKIFLDHLRKIRSLLDGAPTLYLMSSDMFAVFQSVMDRAGINLASKENYGDETLKWGNSLVMALGDKPGTSQPIISTIAGETSIYPVRLALDGVHGVSPEGDKLIEVFLPNMKAPGAVKKGEVEMVSAVAVKSTRSAGKLTGIGIG